MGSCLLLLSDTFLQLTSHMRKLRLKTHFHLGNWPVMLRDDVLLLATVFIVEPIDIDNEKNMTIPLR